MPARVVVARESPRDIRFRNLEVYLDGEFLGDLAYEGKLDREVDPGEHELRVTNRLYSRSERFTAAEGEVVAYEGANIASGCGAVMMMVLGVGPYRVELMRR